MDTPTVPTKKNFNIQFRVLEKALEEGALNKDWFLKWIEDNKIKSIGGQTKKNPICVEIVKRELGLDHYIRINITHYIDVLVRDGHYPKNVPWSIQRKDPKYRQDVLEKLILEKYTL